MAEACLIRTSSERGESPLVDVVTFPDSVLEGDEKDPKLALYDYIRKICLDWAEAHGRTEPMEPVDFLDLPDEFKAKYGVGTKPVDVPFAIALDMDHAITGEDPVDPETLAAIEARLDGGR